MCRCQVIALVLTLAATPALGDVLFLKGGGRVTGEIVSETAESVTVDIGAGKMTVPKSSVVRVETSASPLQSYRAKAASLAPGDVEGWRALGRWAAAQGLSLQAREAFTKVKAVVPNDPEANQALGLVLLDGHWVTEKESFIAHGFVQLEGEWMMPAERQAILGERQAGEEADRKALDAQIQAEQAERAEQKAREAEESNIWNGPLDQNRADWDNGIYGYGPTYWPAQPLTQPASPRPAARRRQ
ncbi:MAG TPA: hypothetical protein VGM86_09705 [Thermoanaerobaculia bacterium]|jgi:tetratricopeptide (TPR) repeat protein